MDPLGIAFALLGFVVGLSGSDQFSFDQLKDVNGREDVGFGFLRGVMDEGVEVHGLGHGVRVVCDQGSRLRSGALGAGRKAASRRKGVTGG